MTNKASIDVNDWFEVDSDGMVALSRRYKVDGLVQAEELAEKALARIVGAEASQDSIISFDAFGCSIGLHVALKGRPTEADYALAKEIDKTMGMTV